MTSVRCLVGVIANDAARFSEFWSCILRLKVPSGSTKEQVIGGDWCNARNELAQRCLDEGYDYLWFMDDDHSFAPDLLQKLLFAAMEYDLPIVNPLCTTRTAPFHLVTYAANPDPNATARYLPISLEGLPSEGIVELEAGGCAGMLIRRDVLEATRSMWWDPDLGGVSDTEVERLDRWFEYTDTSEDIIFCEKAKAAGFKLYADLSCRLGHITTAVVMPGQDENGNWITGLTVGRDLQLAIPRAEDLIAQQETVEFVEEPEVADEFVSAVREELKRPVEDTGATEIVPAPTFSTPGMRRMERIETPIEEPEVFNGAERIEVWVDEELRWWWRGVAPDGRVLRKDSNINEQSAVAGAHLFYPGAPVHLIQREVDDSRNLRPYRVPGRMWDR